MRLSEFKREYPLDPEIIGTIHGQYETPEARSDDEEAKEGFKITLSEKMAELGWFRMGRGTFSDVFQKEGEQFVLKVNTKPDQAFTWFAYVAHKFPNKHFPKIGNAKRYRMNFGKKGDKNFAYESLYVYAVERLSVYGATPWSRGMGVLLRNLATGLCELGDKNLVGPYETFDGSVDVTQKMVDYVIANPSLSEALRIIGKYHKNHMIDIHYDNIAQRGDGTVVIIDPYAF